MPRFEALPALLQANARDDRSLIFVDGEEQQTTLSFAQLQRRALGLLGTLQRRGLRAGDAVILFVQDNAQLLEMFWACALGGLVPVPLAVGNADEHRRKLFRVFAQFDRAWVYSDARTWERMDAFAAAQGFAALWPTMQARFLPLGSLPSDGVAGTPLARRPDDIAFIQFSSGSTGEPKGVVLTHGNLTANIASIIAAARMGADDVALSWMPLSHDMGLIGFHLAMLAAGITHAIMRTELFARRPLLWLSKATELRATLLCSPNFGYRHFLKQHASRAQQAYDLSAVRLIFNGAEPISVELCEEFTATMAAHGLAANAMYPVYGLAEASLAVSFPEPGAPLRTVHIDRAALNPGSAVQRLEAGAPRASALVKLGRAVPDTEIRIADADGAALADGSLGRVLIRGDNVTRGYFRNAAETARVRSADGWLDTGDLGFIADGELVIAGRAKDIIFVNGQNWYPADLEKLAEQLADIDTNRIAVAGVHDRRSGAEDLAVFLLHRGNLPEFVPLAGAVRTLLNQQTGLEIRHLVPVSKLPKTTSGKLQRHLLAKRFEAGEFDAVLAELAPLLDPAAAATQAPAAAGTVARLCAICAEVLPELPIDPASNLLELNLNSLTLARIHEAIDREYPGRLDVTDIFEHPTLQDLAARIDAKG